MAQTRILVTGASGFIGQRLVRQLVADEQRVTCLVRTTSDTDFLRTLDCQIVPTDLVLDPAGVERAVADHDVVFHLAAMTHSVRSKDLVEINTTGMRNLLTACTKQANSPTVVFVSSMAAVGPSHKKQPSREDVPANPVSHYGRSKLACEAIARGFADRVPISIVRPPIVLGDGGRNGLKLFKSIARIGWHFVPTFFNHEVSVIHVDDLVDALIAVGDRGQRLASEAGPSTGIYFAAADQTITYAALGRMIGEAVGRRRTRVLRVPRPLTWGVAATNELIGRVTNKALFLNLDKFHEATSGSWVCATEKIQTQLGFAPAKPLQERLQQTADWYRGHGWLPHRSGLATTDSTRSTTQQPC